jgi:hypothetical protein
VAKEVVSLADAIADEVREALQALAPPTDADLYRLRKEGWEGTLGGVPSKARALLSRLAAIQQRLAIIKQSQPEHNRKIEAFAALLLSLWARLQSHDLTISAYLAAVGEAYDQFIGTVPDAAQATLDRLRQTALDRASNAADTAKLPDGHEDAPSEAQRSSMAHGVAGALWAGLLAVGAYRVAETSGEAGEEALDIWEWQSQDDPATCPDCEALDGQQFSIDEITFWPGEADFGDEPPSGTQCGPNCRCDLTHVANDRSNAPRQSAAKPQVVKEARCPKCRQLEARQVNVGAELSCRKCRTMFKATH